MAPVTLLILTTVFGYRLGRNLSLVVQLIQYQSEENLKKRHLCFFQLLIDGLVSGFYVDHKNSLISISFCLDLALHKYL